MKLTRHLSQGRLVYLSQNDDAISVYENAHYRWLNFGGTVQSIMHKRKPWLLTLPHQIAILLPLLIFRPTNITELGLGGGNIARFITHLSTDISFQSIEESQVVIDSFLQYFNPESCQNTIIHSDGLQWLTQHNNNHWIISDIYRQDEFSFTEVIKQFEQLVEHLQTTSCLTINLPDINDDEMNLSLTVLGQLQSSHQIIYFHIPNYRNIIIHLYPEHWRTEPLLKRNSYLNKVTFNRWKGFWKHGKTIISSSL